MSARIVAILFVLFGPSALADINVEILTVGLPGEGSSKYVYRGGCYAPLAVRLTLSNEQPRSVVIRIEQHDRDGDILTTDKMVGLTPDLKGVGRTHWLYFVPNPRSTAGTGEFSLQILDEDRNALEVMHNGEPTRKVSMPGSPEFLDESMFLVLSITDQTAGKIRTLSDHLDPGASAFAKPLRVAHIQPERVPDHWIGLEMVDAIVWDAADPTQLSVQQQQAMLNWVRRGGRLLIAAGGTSDELKKSEFKDYLPVRLEGVKAAKSLPAELPDATWGRQSGDDVPYARALQVARCVLRTSATPLVQSAAGTQTYLARMQIEQGSITFLALTLRDLFSAEGQPRDFFRRVLTLRRKSDVSEQQQMWGFPERVDLFARMNQFIGFERKTTTYMLIAILFIVVYVLAATGGSWFPLKSRNLLKHSWSVFFAVACAASLIGVLAVQAVQGVGKELHQLTILDTTVDTYGAAAHCYFGLKTSSYVQDVDVVLPQGPPDLDDAARSPHYLRPLSPGSNILETGSSFADTKRYASRPTKAQLSGVPIRATLKQFEGFWLGTMDGQISAKIGIVKQRRAGEPPFTPGSTITNKLGHDLVGCYLIEAQLDPDEDTLRGGRSQTMTVHPIGMIRDGEQVDVVQRLSNLSTAKRKYPQEHRLQDYQRGWVGGLKQSVTDFALKPFRQDPFGAGTDVQRAALLLTTFGEYEPRVDTSSSYRGVSTIELLQTASRWLDRSTEITRRNMLLVGFAPDQEGPVMLYSRRGNGKWSYLLPRKSMIVYRILIPAKREP